MSRDLVDKLETGKIGIFYLKKIWSFYSLQETGGKDKVAWKYINAVFNTLGLGLEPTLKFLFQEKPSFEEFENWIFQNGIVSNEIIQHFNSIILNEAQSISSRSLEKISETVLDEQDLKNWEENGYIILRQAISKEDCEETKSAIYNFIEAAEKDPESWYLDHPNKKGIMVQLFNHEMLNKNRLSKRIRIAYHQLWERSDLLVSMDRVSFNPPETEKYKFPGPNLHWDVSLQRPIPFGLQGLLYLTDTTAEQGAFTLVPGFHKKINTWLDKLPEGTNPRNFNFDNLNPKAVEGKAGDFIIWHQALPHGSSPNRTNRPRIVQYINYQPIEMEVQGVWI